MYKQLLFFVFLSSYAYASQAPVPVLAGPSAPAAAVPQQNDAQQPENTDDATCTICAENFNNSHIRIFLSCDVRHTFCHECATATIEAEGNNAKCPFCRRRFRLHDNCKRALQNLNLNDLSDSEKNRVDNLMRLNRDIEQNRLENGQQNHAEQINEDGIIASRFESLERARQQQRLRRMLRLQANRARLAALQENVRQLEVNQESHGKVLKIVSLIILGTSLGFKLLEGMIRITKRLFTKKETVSSIPAEKAPQTITSSTSDENKPLPASIQI